jgi:HK97 family phage prohead protease/HK97 family phage major capsid protein
MMNKIFNLTSTFKALEEVADGSVMIRGMASTTDFDRAGDSISAEAWTKGGLSNFEKNPIILFNHDYDKPIGRATGLKAGPNGLELEAKISKAAPASVCQLVKDGVLGAFSVGFRVKDADYIQETDGLMIKDAELFEVSVVSVPCNQSATFSLAKSFDSEDEYNEFKKTFTKRVDLAGQSLAKDEVNTSGIASDTPVSAEQSADLEIKMDNQNIDLEAFAKKVADDTAMKIALKQAEQKAAEEAQAKAAQEAEEAKALQAESIKSVVNSGVESGVEKLMSDVEVKLQEKDAKIDEVIAKFSKDLEEKQAEIEAMRNSKRTFDGRGQGDLSKWGKDFMHASLLGTFTGKGMDTDFARGVMEKAGIDYTTNAGDIDQEVSRQIEKEVTLNLRTAGLFREIQVNGAATVLPIQPDVEPAVFQTGAAASGNLENRGASDNTYKPSQVILNAYRLISQTFMDNNVDEQVLVNLMPMLVDSVARAHARAVDNAIINGSGSITGLDGFATANSDTLSLGSSEALTAAKLLAARKDMGKYGINPGDLAYIVSQARYFELIEDSGFQDVTDVGSDMATKITGQIGSVFGTPVVVSDSFPTEAAGAPAAFAVNLRNYVIPRLRGVQVETDYEVGNQRNVIVASQALGFEELVADAAGNRSAVKIDIAS